MVLEFFLLITYYSRITCLLGLSADFKATIPLSLKLKSPIVFNTYNLYEEIENNSWPFPQIFYWNSTSPAAISGVTGFFDINNRFCGA